MVTQMRRSHQSRPPLVKRSRRKGHPAVRRKETVKPRSSSAKLRIKVRNITLIF